MSHHAKTEKYYMKQTNKRQEYRTNMIFFPLKNEDFLTW